ncbi:MAG: type III pantothenate kinase [Fimbriimonadales bacterium]
MQLVIDVGNTHTVFGIHQMEWTSVWRMPTDPLATEDRIAAFFLPLCRERSIPPQFDEVFCASVVPALDQPLRDFASRWLKRDARFLNADSVPNLKINYSPASAVGADRLANAVAVKANHRTPAIVVDFGTATTFDAIGPNGEYEGGRIMPGPIVSMEALFSRAAKLPTVELAAPKTTIGRDTKGALQSGLVIGYAGAIDTIVRRMKLELPSDAFVLATGGLAALFAPLCDEVNAVDDLLTLDGIRIALA